MSMLSIPSHKTDDPNYRYKMPKLVAKVEGRGNGIRTNIVNMADIARALKRPADYPTKFCGHELGAQSKFDPAEGKAIVNGAHEQRDLQVLIDKFIEKYVLCQHCALPEIDLQLKKGRVTYHCNACGDQGEVDATHKLTTFILKNPPEVGDSTLGPKKKSKEERQREKALKSKPKTREDGADSDGEKKKEKKKDGSSKEKKEKKSGKKSKTNSPDEENDEVRIGSGDMEKKSKKRKEKSVEELDHKSSEGLTEAVTENLTNFMTVIEDGKRKLNESITPREISDHLRLLQLTQGFGGRSKVFVLLDVLFSSDFGEMTQASLEKYSKYLFPISQNTSQRDVLAALEDFILARTGTIVPDGFRKFPYFLQELYSADVLTEEGILKHYESKKVEAECRDGYAKAKVAAQPFLTWLRENDSEEDSEDEDDEQEEQKQNGGTGLSVPTSSTKTTDVKNDDSDVDLDDI